MTAMFSASSASAAINSFSPGVNVSVGVDFTDPTQWTLGHVPNSTSEQIVIPPGGQVNGAVTMTFNGGNVVGSTLTDASSAGRILSNGGAQATLELGGLAGQPTLLDSTGGLQLSLGNGSIGGNNITLQLDSTSNEFRNLANNAIKVYADITESQPGTGVTLTAPTGAGTFILGGNNSFTGALNVQAPLVTFDYTVKNGQMIGSAGSLIFNGGTMNVNGSTSGTSQAVAQTVFNAGSTQFIFTNPSINAATFNFGAISRSVGAVANLVATTGSGAFPVVTTSTANSNGILGGWLVTNGNTITNTVFNWAANDGSGNIVPFTAYNTKNNLTTWATNDNINITDPTTVSGSVGDADDQLASNQRRHRRFDHGQHHGSAHHRQRRNPRPRQFGDDGVIHRHRRVNQRHDRPDHHDTLGQRQQGCHHCRSDSDRDASHPVGITKSQGGTLTINGCAVLFRAGLYQ